MTSYLKKYAKLNETEELQIDVRYSLGGTSWFDGKRRPRGIKLGFTPVRRQEHNGYSTLTTTLMDDRGRSFHIKDLSRQSNKQGKLIAQFVEQNFDEIAAAAVQQDWDGVAAIMRNYQ
jgi:hypothetical protein